MIAKKQHTLFAKNLLLTFSFLLLFMQCKKKDTPTPAPLASKETTFGIFKVLNSQTVEMNGEIKTQSLANFNRLIAQYPNIKKINIKSVPGSSDDELNLQLSLKVHRRGISTHLMNNGDISSGGVDFFLAGVKRTIGTNVKIGVHSWSGNDKKEAKDFPRGHSEHLRYIKYYTDIGFSRAQAEAFYYFTINAAPAAGMHWMTPEEIKKYHILSTPPAPPTPKQTTFGIFKVLNSQTVEMNGEIKTQALDSFNRLIAQHPNIKKINIKSVPGSSDAVMTLQLGLKVHKRGISTHLMNNGVIASSGVDFFLAGIKRTTGTNVKIGVHSWSGNDKKEAKDFPRGHAEHQPYIKYYTEIGFSPALAKAFYFFTINAAPPESMHWMTTAEIKTYGILKN